MHKTRQQQLEAAKKSLEELAAVDASLLGRRNDLSRDINFEDVVADFEELLQLAKQLRNRDISRLSANHLGEVKQGANEVLTRVRRVQEFSLAGDDPVGRCEQLKDDVRNIYENVYQRLVVPLSFTATQETDYSKIEREAKGLVLTVQSEAASFRDEIAKMKEAGQAALSDIQKQAAEAGVSQNAIYFRKDALRQRAMAEKWKRATIWLTVATGCYVALMLLLAFVYTPASVLAATQLFVAKVLGFSVLSVTTLWCAKNYASHRHNEMVDQHRQNALATFKTFVSGAESASVRDAVLLQASSATFGPRSTGFEGGKIESAPASPPIIEVLDRVSGAIPATSTSS